MCATLLALQPFLTAGAAAASILSSVKGAENADKATKNQEQANAAATANAKATADAADQAYNKANPKVQREDVSAANMLYGSQGLGSTMLTGATGVDQSTLTLGKKTLIGA